MLNLRGDRLQGECRAVEFLAALFGEDAEILKFKKGLPSKYHPCLNCGQPTRALSQLCSVDCFKQQHHVTVICTVCGRAFTIGQSVFFARLRKRKVEGWFCNRHCYGRYLGKNYGFHRNSTSRVKVNWLRRLGFTREEIIKFSSLKSETVDGYLYRRYRRRYPKRRLELRIENAEWNPLQTGRPKSETRKAIEAMQAGDVKRITHNDIVCQKGGGCSIAGMLRTIEQKEDRRYEYYHETQYVAVVRRIT